MGGNAAEPVHRVPCGQRAAHGGMGSSGDPFEFDVAHGYEEMPESEKIAVEEDLLIGREPRDLV